MRLVDETATGDRTGQDASDDHPDAALEERTVATVAAVADAAAAVDVGASAGAAVDGAAADGTSSTVAPDMAVLTVVAATPGAAVVAQTVSTTVAVVVVETRYPYFPRQ